MSARLFDAASTSTRGPIAVYVAEHDTAGDARVGGGLVWSADDVVALRHTFRIVGTMIGGMSGVRQQITLSGLPLQLSNDELALALSKGWVRVVNDRVQVAEGGDASRPSKAAGNAPPDVASLSQVAGDEGKGGKAVYFKKPVKKKAKKATASEAQRDPWGHALLGPNSVEVPYLPPAASAAAAASTAAAALPRYPATVAERRRHRVFCELHERGYTMTCGAKFGSDFLAYPGDPMLFHAQFSVRIVPWDEPLHLQSFAAGTRVAHTARKNLLMASVRDLGNAAGEEEVVFFSVVPDISQSSNKKLFSGQQRQ